MLDVKALLYEICEDKNVFNPDFDLIESGIMDSLSFIELFSALEDYGIELQPTRIDRTMLRTSGTIEKLISQYK